MEYPAPTREAPQARFVFVDGLRGLAALAVALLHVAREPLSDVSPLAGSIVSRGTLGVWVFFVISGFVIAHTLGRVPMTLTTAGRFLVRRMARLDPPYWASIVLTLVVAGLSAAVIPGRRLEMPSVATIGAHLVYMQYILGIGSVSDVYWTLCLEIQFYLLLVLLIALKQRAERATTETLAMAAVFGPVLLGSFFFAIGVLPTPQGGCFPFWYAFAVGGAAQRVVAGRGWGALGVAAATSLIISVITGRLEGTVAAVTAVAIAIGHARGQLGTWLSWRPFQYLGRISYSLYLIHGAVGARGANLVARFFPATPGWRVVCAGIGMAMAIAAADVFWHLFERPSIELGRWLARSTRQRAAARAAAPTSL